MGIPVLIFSVFSTMSEDFMDFQCANCFEEENWTSPATKSSAKTKKPSKKGDCVFFISFLYEGKSLLLQEIVKKQNLPKQKQLR